MKKIMSESAVPKRKRSNSTSSLVTFTLFQQVSEARCPPVPFPIFDIFAPGGSGSWSSASRLWNEDDVTGNGGGDAFPSLHRPDHRSQCDVKVLITPLICSPLFLTDSSFIEPVLRDPHATYSPPPFPPPFTTHPLLAASQPAFSKY